MNPVERCDITIRNSLSSNLEVHDNKNYDVLRKWSKLPKESIRTYWNLLSFPNGWWAVWIILNESFAYCPRVHRPKLKLAELEQQVVRVTF